MGMAPIPFTAIVEYANIEKITESEFETFRYVIRRMDNELLRNANNDGKNPNSNA